MSNNAVLLKKWQKLLGLQDWKIKLLDNCTPADMVTKDCGETEYNEVQKCAYIRILSPQYYGETEFNIPFCQEKTLLHELLHIKFALLDDNGNEMQSRVLHQIIEDLARALYLAKKI